MKRFLFVVIWVFVFSISLTAGHIPTTNYDACPYPGIYWQATWPDTVSYCCQPNEYCPVGGGEGRLFEAPIIKPDGDINFRSIFLNFYREKNSMTF